MSSQKAVYSGVSFKIERYFSLFKSVKDQMNNIAEGRWGGKRYGKLWAIKVLCMVQ